MHTVVDERINLVIIILQLESRKVGVGSVRMVWYVKDDRNAQVRSVTAKDGRMRVQTAIDKSVRGGWNLGIGNLSLEEIRIDTIPSLNKRRAIGPKVLGIGTGVDGNYDVDLTCWFEERPKRDILGVFTAVDKVELSFASGIIGTFVDAVESVWI
jgi:hypothetical protein